jgi:hypothetical protein
MSTMALVQGPNGVTAAWDTDGQVYFTTIEPGTTEFTRPRSAPGAGGERRHPSLAVNARGETLLAWTEGTAWQKGGALAWQIFDQTGRPTNVKGSKERAIPVWGLPAVVAAGDGFAIIH